MQTIEAQDTFTFELIKFQRALRRVLPDVAVTKTNNRGDYLDIILSGSRVRFISVPHEYEGKQNFINIYHGESSKNGFVWNHKINYQQLAREISRYHSKVQYA